MPPGAPRRPWTRSASSISSACLQDTLFTEESTEDDLTLARRALLAEAATPEDIAAAAGAALSLAGCRRPEDILDPGGGAVAGPRDDSRCAEKDATHRGMTAPVAKADALERAKMRDGMAEGSVVVFRAAIGRQKECRGAPGLLPMICRRGRPSRRGGHRRHQDFRRQYRVRDFRGGGGNPLPAMIKRPRQGRQHPHRGAAERPGRGGRTLGAAEAGRPRLTPASASPSYKDKSWKGQAAPGMNGAAAGMKNPMSRQNPRYEEQASRRKTPS